MIDVLQKEVETLKGEWSRLKMVMKERDSTFRGLIEGTRDTKNNENLLDCGQNYDDAKKY